MIAISDDHSNMKIRLRALAVLGALGLAGEAVAQPMNFACKAIGGWQPQTDSNAALAGRCDVNGLMQGEAVARGQGAFIRARFVDGYPIGPASMSTDQKALLPNSRADYAPVCKLNFVSSTELTGDIQCTVKRSLPGNVDAFLNWTLTSATNFKIDLVPTDRWVGRERKAAGSYLSATGVLLKSVGPMQLDKLPRNLYDEHIREHTGQLLGTVDLSLAPFHVFISGDLTVNNTAVELKSMDLNYTPYRPVWITGFSGQLKVRFPYHMILPVENIEFGLTRGMSQLASGHPVDREMTIKYSSGYEVTFVSTGSSFAYFRDNREVEFNGFIPECLKAPREPGYLSFGIRWPPRFLLTNTTSDSFNSARPATGNPLVPSGCGAFKSGGNPELRGVFRTQGNSDSVTLTPF